MKTEVKTYDYKAEIKMRISWLKAQGRPVTLKRVADRIGVQYTYLSKILNDRDLHLSEDQVFAIGQLLELYPQEIELWLFMRSYCSSSNQDRKRTLLNALEKAHSSQFVSAEFRASQNITALDEAAYLFDPLSIIAHAALDIAKYKNDLRQLARDLQLPWAEMKTLLLRLERLEFIELDENLEKVRKIKKSSLHYGKDHPLMRMHQLAMKQFSTSNLMRIKEDEKDSFMVTFTTGDEGRNKISALFEEFLQAVQKEIPNHSETNVYQMSFDFFRCL